MKVKGFTEEESKATGTGTPSRPLEFTNNTQRRNFMQQDASTKTKDCQGLRDATEAVVLLALYLQGWKEESTRNPEQFVFRAWKGYSFEILNRLQAEGMIFQKKGMKSVLLNPEAQKMAESLKMVLFDALGVDHD